MPRSLPLLALVVGLFAVGCQRFQTRRDMPPVPPAARSAAPDDAKPPLRERLKEKREERRGTKDTEPPKLPSPVAPKEPIPKTDAPGTAKDQGADAPRSPGSPTDELAAVRKLYEAAARRYEALTDFEARMVRREVVKNRDTPQEELLFQYRKAPLSVYMKETVAKGIGKEVLYVQGKFENRMHVLIGTAEANFLMKAGSVHSFDPHNPMVTSRSRKRIDEAGFGDSLARFGKFIEQTAAGTRPNGVRYLGFVDRKEYPYPLEGIEAKLLPGDDPHLPKGGTKTAFFDMKQGSQGYGVPVVAVTLDETGREVEYYCFDRIRLPAGLTDADFHPDRPDLQNLLPARQTRPAILTETAHAVAETSLPLRSSKVVGFTGWVAAPGRRAGRHSVCSRGPSADEGSAMVLTASGEELARPYSILIADDDRGNREALSDLLTRRGFHTVTAADGKEAVEIVRVELVHLVLIDMHMPRLTGLEAVQILRQQINQLLPAILMTADATRELMRQAHQAQVYSVIPKPIDLRQALHTLAQALAQVYGPPPPNPAPNP